MPITSPDWASLLPALLDFERSPGRYPVVLREPRPLFDHTLAVLQLATGRAVDGLADREQDRAHADDLKRAARFFVRTVLLRPGVDHYTLLGLAPGCEAAELREHYRLMIRLTHPDFAAGRDEAWPADAATRINQANDVLSSAVRRADYNATLAPAVHAAPAATQPAAPRPLALRAGVTPRRLKKETRQADARPWRERLPRSVKIALAAVGALGAAVALVLNTTTGDSGSLSVRKIPTVAAPSLQAATSLAMADALGAGATLATAGALDGAAADGAAVDGLMTTSAPAMAPMAVAEAPPAAPPRPRRGRARAEAAALEAAATGNAGLSLTMDTRLGTATMGAKAVSASAPAPSPAAAPALLVSTVAPPAAAPAQPAAAETAATAASSAAAPAPTLVQVQPLLSNLVASLPSGRGENMAQWIDNSFRPHPDTGRFVGRFNQLLAGQRVTQLGNVRFSSRTQGAQLVVDGVIELHTQDMNNEARVRDLHLRAFFQPQDGQAVLTQLVAGKFQ
jgi:hypothetical protein